MEYIFLFFLCTYPVILLQREILCPINHINVTIIQTIDILY